jgi:hypothetical protein
MTRVKLPPPVDMFYTFDGLLEYCRQHLPNCYQQLLMMKDSASWQARLAYSRFGLFDAKQEGIPLYRYFDGLELLAKGTYHEKASWDELKLYSYEQAFIGEVRDGDKIHDAIERHMPLPPDFDESDTN